MFCCKTSNMCVWLNGMVLLLLYYYYWQDTRYRLIRTHTASESNKSIRYTFVPWVIWIYLQYTTCMFFTHLLTTLINGFSLANLICMRCFNQFGRFFSSWDPQMYFLSKISWIIKIHLCNWMHQLLNDKLLLSFENNKIHFSWLSFFFNRDTIQIRKVFLFEFGCCSQLSIDLFTCFDSRRKCQKNKSARSDCTG